MPSVKPLSQPEAELYRPNEREVLISIATPKFIDTVYPKPNLANWKNNPVLRLAFHDSDQQKSYDDKLVYMCSYDAHRIAVFADEHRGKDFVIHCWAGKSRSPTVAWFIHTIFAKDHYRFIGNRSGQTNAHVKRTLFKAFRERLVAREILNGFLIFKERGDLLRSQAYEAGFRAALKYCGKA